MSDAEVDEAQGCDSCFRGFKSPHSPRNMFIERGNRFRTNYGGIVHIAKKFKHQNEVVVAICGFEHNTTGRGAAFKVPVLFPITCKKCRDGKL